MTPKQKTDLIEVANFFLGAGILVFLTSNYCNKQGCEWLMYKIIQNKSTAAFVTFFLVFYSLKFCLRRDNIVTKITNSSLSFISEFFINASNKLKRN